MPLESNAFKGYLIILCQLSTELIFLNLLYTYSAIHIIY